MPLVYSFRAPDRNAFECPVHCQQCDALTRRGARCRQRVCFGAPMCWQHLMSERKLRIKKSNVQGAGKGLFAMQRGVGPQAIVFRRGDVVTKYEGEVMTDAGLTARYGNYTAPYGISVSNDVYENGACRRGAGAMINHATGNRVNVEFVENGDNRSEIRALKAIRNGQELLVDYGANYQFDEPTRSRTVRRRA